MDERNLSRAMMALGALDELAEVIENRKAINYDTLPDRIRRCTGAIAKSLWAENSQVIDNAGENDVSNQLHKYVETGKLVG